MTTSLLQNRPIYLILFLIAAAACTSPTPTATVAPTEPIIETPIILTETPSPTQMPTLPPPTETAEPITFELTIGGNRQDRGINLLQTSDGGFAFVGYTSSPNAVGEDVYVVRTDAEGEMVWSQTYGGEGADNGWAILETEDNGFIIVGFTNSFGAGDMDIYLVRTDTNGTLLWEHTFGGPEDEYGWAMTTTADGGYILAGQTESFGEGQEDGYVVKVSAEGQEIWSQTVGGPQEDRIFSIDQDAESGFILTGTTRSFGEGQRDLYLVNVDESGDISWSQVYGESRDDVGHSVRRTADNGYIITGYTQSFGAANYDMWLVKTDESGELEWQNFFGGPNDDRTIFGEQTADGGYILTGYTDGFEASGWDVFLVRTDAEGNVIWHTTFGGPANDTGYTAMETADNGFLLTGETYSFGEGAGDMYVIKVNQDGQLVR